jgi:uncharacterized protein YkwD
MNETSMAGIIDNRSVHTRSAPTWLVTVTLIVILMVMAVQSCAAGADATTVSTSNASAVQPDEVARTVVQLTNGFRQQEDRAALHPKPDLTATAHDFAQFMARTDKYGHDADGSTPSARAQQHGYASCSVAENIAFQYRSSSFDTTTLSRALFEGWKGSPPHRRNMLLPDMADTGVGVAHSDRTGRWYAVQLFGLPKSAQASFQVTNKADAVVKYRLDDRSYDLPPRVTRIHKRCGSTELVMHWPGEQPETTIEPRDGERYDVVRRESGDWSVERE